MTATNYRKCNRQRANTSFDQVAHYKVIQAEKVAASALLLASKAFDAVAHLANRTEELTGIIAPLVKKNQELEQLLLKDLLTGADSRMAMNEKLGEAVNRFLHNRHNKVVVYAIDADHLKKINDEQGHHAGDLYLKALSASMRLRLRLSDSLSRPGGDEFAVIAETNDPDGLALHMIQHQKDMAKNDGLHFSMGYAVLDDNFMAQQKDRPSPEILIERLIQAADSALYEDKKTKEARFIEAGRKIFIAAKSVAAAPAP